MRNELGGSGSNTQEGQDIWVCQAFPQHGLSAEGLCILLVTEEGKAIASITDFDNLLWTILSIHPHTFDANL